MKTSGLSAASCKPTHCTPHSPETPVQSALRETPVHSALRNTWLNAVAITLGALVSAATCAAPAVITRGPIGALAPLATIQVGKTADWVAVTHDAVWVGSTGPDAVSRIDPKTNRRVAVVRLNGEPCAGLSIGFGSLWVPLCGSRPTLARIDLASDKLTGVFPIGPGAAEGGITSSADSVWLVVDKAGSVLARIDPVSGRVRQTVRMPAGSYNPRYSDGRIWVTQAGGAQTTSVDARTGALLATVHTGPGPRFLTSGAGAVWTLNQGDGSLSRIDTGKPSAPVSVALGTPGHGGDIGFGAGMVWVTVANIPLSGVDAASAALRCQWTGPGGDSLGVGHGAIWLTNYHAGTIARIDLRDAVARCHGAVQHIAQAAGS